jgi:hypothetical protein
MPTSAGTRDSIPKFAALEQKSYYSTLIFNFPPRGNMSISLKKARDFVYSTGVLWEKALFGYLFEDRSLEHLHQCLLCYKNPDNGWGHALEHDVKTPDSHIAALEFLLAACVRDLDIPLGNLLDDTPEWLEQQRNDDGSLKNPDSLRDYPAEPWWIEWNGQKAPDSVVGNLTKIGKSTPSLDASTLKWAQTNLTLNKIQANEWLFMIYHAFDYFMNVDNFHDVQTYRQAVIDNMRSCAEKMPERQYAVILQFAPTPDSMVARAMPEFVARSLEYVQDTQRDDGGWTDEHNMKHWQPYFTTMILRALSRHNRLQSGNVTKFSGKLR